MEHAPEVANVVEACSVEGRQERLDSLLAGLELCEKALQVLGRQALGWGHKLGNFLVHSRVHWILQRLQIACPVGRLGFRSMAEGAWGWLGSLVSPLHALGQARQAPVPAGDCA